MNPYDGLPAYLQARIERAAILEFDAGMTREDADKEAARLHPEPKKQKDED